MPVRNTRKNKALKGMPTGAPCPDQFNRDGFRYSFVDIARTMSAAGFTTNADLGPRFGVSATTIGRWKQRFPDFAAAIEGGHAEMVDELTHRMLALSREGSESATRFLLERRVPTFQPSAKVAVTGKVEGLGEMLSRRMSEDELKAAGILTDEE